MDSKCYAFKKNRELCNVKLTDKNRNKKELENNTIFVCGKHKNVKSIHDVDISKYKNIDDENIEKDFEKKINLYENNKIKKQENIDSVYLNEDIPYPFTMPIMCFTCNTVISRIDIFNKLWEIYNNNINNKIEYINKILEEENIDKNKWKRNIKNKWWQKIGGFEEINDEIELSFEISDEEWKNIGIENLCCRRMIYTHEENPLFVYGPSNY